MAAILIIVECPKSIMFEVLLVKRPYQYVKSIWHALFKLPHSQAISCIGYNVNLQTAMAAILIFRRMPQINSICHIKIRSQSVFKLPHSQAISCIGYNVNLENAVAAILIFVECPKSIASEVLVVLRPYQNVKSIRQAVFKLQHSQTISCTG